MILGGVSKLGKTTLWISEKGQRINSILYCSIIKDHAIPLIENAYNGIALLLHDRATCHTSHYTSEKLSILETKLNPPHSPDLNPLEMMWSIVKSKVEKSSK